MNVYAHATKLSVLARFRLLLDCVVVLAYLESAQVQKRTCATPHDRASLTHHPYHNTLTHKTHPMSKFTTAQYLPFFHVTTAEIKIELLSRVSHPASPTLVQPRARRPNPSNHVPRSPNHLGARTPPRLYKSSLHAAERMNTHILGLHT